MNLFPKTTNASVPVLHQSLHWASDERYILSWACRIRRRHYALEVRLNMFKIAVRCSLVNDRMLDSEELQRSDQIHLYIGTLMGSRMTYTDGLLQQHDRSAESSRDLLRPVNSKYVKNMLHLGKIRLSLRYQRRDWINGVAREHDWESCWRV